MNIIKLDLDSLPPRLFDQMVVIEENCGLEPYTPEVLRYYIESADTYACLDGETVAGFITMGPCTDYFDESLHIININVKSAYRRQGLAQKMIRTVCKNYALSHAGQAVTLDVCKTNDAAMNLYAKLGFTVSGFPSENGDTDVVMTLPLSRLLA